METTENPPVPQTTEIPAAAETAATPTPAATGQTPAAKPSVLTKFNSLTLQLKVAIIGAAILFFLLALIASTSPRRSEVSVLVPSPLASAQPEATPFERQTSEFAKTEEFKKFEQNIESLRVDNTSVDLSEAQLSFPLLDMRVNFDRPR